MNELDELCREYDRLRQRIQPSVHRYTFQTARSDDGSPHVEFAEGEFHYIVTERGLELDRRSTQDTSEILYWMLYDATFWMGVDHEFRNRIEGSDCRRMIFARQTELMKLADKAMAERLEKQIAGILAVNPFVDR